MAPKAIAIALMAVVLAVAVSIGFAATSEETASADSTWVPVPQSIDQWDGSLTITGDFEGSTLVGLLSPLIFGVHPDALEIGDADQDTQDEDAPPPAQGQNLFNYFFYPGGVQLVSSRVPLGATQEWTLLLQVSATVDFFNNRTATIYLTPGLDQLPPGTTASLLTFPNRDPFAILGNDTIQISVPIQAGQGSGNAFFVVTVAQGEVPLTAPTLLSPVDEALTSGGTPLFQWSASQGEPDNYSLHVAKTGDIDTGPYVVDENIAPPGTSDESTALTEDGVYQWRVIAEKTDKTPEISDVFSFTLDTTGPAAPVLVFPGEGEAIAEPAPLLDWDHPDTGDVPEYVLRVTSGDIIAGDVVIDDLIIEGASPAPTEFQIDPQAPLADGAYQWRVTARDVLLNATDSEVGNFTVDTTPPTPPGLLLPDDGDILGFADVGPTRTVEFTWSVSSSGDVVAYQLQVTSGDTFDAGLDVDVPVPHPAVETFVTATAGLTGDGLYQWRVNALDAPGNQTSGNLLLFQTFTVDITPPDAPTPLTPIGPTNDPDPFFDWTPASGDDLVSYELQVTSGFFSSGPFDLVKVITGNPPVSEFQAIDPLGDNAPGQSYSWRVISRDDVGNASTSDDGTFNVDTFVADPVLVFPPADGVIGNRQPTFQWTHIGDRTPPVDYVLLVKSGDQVVIDEAVDGISFPAPTPLLIKGQVSGDRQGYSWEVQAFDDLGNFSKVVSGDFTIDLNAPIPVLISPADGSATRFDVTRLEWDISGETEGVTYDVLVSGDSGGIREFRNVAHAQGTSQTIDLSGQPITAEGSYEWFVRATRAGLEGPASASFDIDRSIATPVLLLPVPGAVVGTTTPTFAWEPIVEPHGPVTYILLVEHPVLGVPPIDVETEDTSFTLLSPPLPLLTTPYSWSVTARDAAGNESPSEVRQFKVDLSAPLVELRAPVDDDILTEDRPTFEWQASDTVAAAELGIQVFDPIAYDLRDLTPKK